MLLDEPSETICLPEKGSPVKISIRDTTQFRKGNRPAELAKMVIGGRLRIPPETIKAVVSHLDIDMVIPDTADWNQLHWVKGNHIGIYYEPCDEFFHLLTDVGLTLVNEINIYSTVFYGTSLYRYSVLTSASNGECWPMKSCPPVTKHGEATALAYMLLGQNESLMTTEETLVGDIVRSGFFSKETTERDIYDLCLMATLGSGSSLPEGCTPPGNNEPFSNVGPDKDNKKICIMHSYGSTVGAAFGLLYYIRNYQADKI